jgi:hypothetical protein
VKRWLGLFLTQQALIEDGRSTPRQVRPVIPAIGSGWEIHAPDDRRDGAISPEDRRFARLTRYVLPGASEQTQDVAIFTPRRPVFRCRSGHVLIHKRSVIYMLRAPVGSSRRGFSFATARNPSQCRIAFFSILLLHVIAFSAIYRSSPPRRSLRPIWWT